MPSDHCGECQRPIRIVRVSGWDKGPKDGSYKIPLDYVKAIEGDYAVAGPDTAIFIKAEERADFDGPLYTDHRRTCPMKKSDVDPDRPQLSKVTITCDVCGAFDLFATVAEIAKECVVRFTDQHLNCRGRKAS